MKILIIDDETDMLEMLQMALENRGHTVILAPNTRMALQAIDQNPLIDIMLVDLKMEGDELRGFKSIEYAKEKLASLPTIYLMVASVPVETQEMARSLGVKDILFKPFSLAVFFRTLGI